MRDRQMIDHRIGVASQIITAGDAITPTATKWGMVGGTMTTAYGWLSSAGTAVFVGVLVTILGFIISAVYQRRREKREVDQINFNKTLALSEENRRMAHEARMIELHQAQLNALKANKDGQ